MERSRALAAALRTAGVRLRYDEVPANHAGVVGARYDPTVRRCVPSDDPAVRAAARRTVDLLAAV